MKKPKRPRETIATPETSPTAEAVASAIMRFRLHRRDPTARHTLKLIATKFQKVEAAAHAVVRERRLYVLNSEIDRRTATDFDDTALGRATARLETDLFFAMEVDEAPNLCAFADELKSLVRRTPEAPAPDVSRKAIREWLCTVDPMEVMKGAAVVVWQAEHFFDHQTLAGPDPAGVELVRWAEAQGYPRAQLARDMAEQDVRDKPGRESALRTANTDAQGLRAAKEEAASKWEERLKKWHRRAPKGDKAAS
jgi:hypothetical protein